MRKNLKRYAATASIALCVALIISASIRAETPIQPGDVAGRLGQLTAFLLPLAGLFCGVRSRMKLTGHNHKVGRQAIAAILFWYSLFAVAFGALVLLYERGRFGLAIGGAMIGVWSGAAYGFRRWQRRLRAAERGLATPPQS